MLLGWIAVKMYSKQIFKSLAQFCFWQSPLESGKWHNPLPKWRTFPCFWSWDSIYCLPEQFWGQENLEQQENCHYEGLSWILKDTLSCLKQWKVPNYIDEICSIQFCRSWFFSDYLFALLWTFLSINPSKKNHLTQSALWEVSF